VSKKTNKEKNIALFKILIADEHAASQKAMQVLFTDQPDFIVVGLINDASQAVKLATKTRPDLVMIDMVLPRAGGVQAVQEIKSQLPQTALLVCSAYAEKSYILQMLQSGVQGYILKSASKEEIINAARTVASGDYYFDSLISRKLTEMLLNYNQKTPESASSAHLSIREIEILQLAARGLSNKYIAENLGLTERTVKNYMSAILSKMRCASRSEAIAKGLEEGYLTP
jgi:DNA-binding NarL/FixJ family response regulator